VDVTPICQAKAFSHGLPLMGFMSVCRSLALVKTRTLVQLREGVKRVSESLTVASFGL
jgi:hypothetical protein